MSRLTKNPAFTRLAALAEILLVLAVGNIVGVAVYEAVLPVSVKTGDAGEIVEALFAGLRILLRIGFIAGFGLALLWLRRGLGPRDAGLTRAGKPLGHLLGIGFVLGGFSSFLVALVFAVHAVAPLGAGLAAWNNIREASLSTAFYVDMLATSIIVPPLVEEIMARGYMRLRLVESYGRVSGVILTGLVFALAHGKFVSTDPLLAIFMVVLIISSIAWAYIAQTSGSLIPPMIAHAMTNLFATVILFEVWIPFAAVTVFVLWQRQPIITTLRQFAGDWRAEQEAWGLWFGVVTLVLLIAALMVAMSQLGRTSGLVALAAVALSVTVANIGLEKRG